LIVIVSSDTRERAAFSALCEARGWRASACDSLRALRRTLSDGRPNVIVARQKVRDGYSDDVFSLVAARGQNLPGIIILAAANTASSDEARQLALGADCVLRDPVRPEVLAAYMAKFRNRSVPDARRPALLAPALQFAGALLDPTTRTLQLASRQTQLTPRELALVRALLAAPGEVVTYDELYDHVLGRRFKGDTSNMRVLLGKLCSSAAAVGLTLRPWIQVIAKTGYRYAPPALRTVRSSGSSRTAA
jgi:two-component system response regulator TctD